MALTGANELKRRMMIKVEGEPYSVVEVTFSSPSARGATTMVRTRLRHLLTGAVLEKSFRSGEKFEEPDVVYTPASFMYSDSEGFHFMDEQTFEQFMLPAEQVGDDRGYLTDGLVVQVLKYNGEAVALELPQYVELTVAETEPGVKGDTAGGGRDTKPATLETGIQVRVPLFIKEGERVRVNTQTGEVAGRA
ncbi:MAG TPA: elongation factor P [Pyrinomonadaceae bacterium]|nr:elongation factor P [Pyrinomonadaceae bacterium]